MMVNIVNIGLHLLNTNMLALSFRASIMVKLLPNRAASIAVEGFFHPVRKKSDFFFLFYFIVYYFLKNALREIVRTVRDIVSAFETVENMCHLSLVGKTVNRIPTFSFPNITSNFVE